jgi:hypothetical protein
VLPLSLPLTSLCATTMDSTSYISKPFCSLVGISSFLSPSMSHSLSGPAPPSPVLTHFDGRPTPPPSPPRARPTLAVDDYAPCPPTPRCVPDEDCNSGSSSGSNYWSISELDHSTSFADPLIDETSNDQARYDDPVPHVSDSLIYDRKTYAYPSPVLTMIGRATFDANGLAMQPVDPRACGEPFKLFSLSAGHTPVTGLAPHDEQSFDYYNKFPHPSPLREPECSLSYRFSISTIRALQHELRTEWLSVYPEPIPPIVIRSSDLVGPYCMSRRKDGYAFVVPTEDSIWGTILQRGIDSTFRPLNPSAAVETDMCTKGAAHYYPHHIVASNFAVNVFLELPNIAGLTPRCEYLGAYVLQVMDGLTIKRSIWADIDPQVQQFVFDRVPDYFEGPQHPSLGCPLLPYVHLCYYKWDGCIIGLADEIRNRNILEASPGIAPESESVDSDDHSDSSDSGFDTDRSSTPSVYSDEEEFTSFLNLSPCE